MSGKRKLRKVLTIAGWCTAGAAALTILVAAINMKNTRKCTSSRIEINEGKGRYFLDQKDIMAMLTGEGKQKLTGKTVVSYDLAGMEELLRKNPWVRDVQVFFDHNEVLRIRVSEREPVARVFTVTGSGFLIDSSGAAMPLPGRHMPSVPVFTGFPAEKWKAGSTDGALMDQVRRLAVYIGQDPFWSADIQQVNIAPDRNFQMVPMVGNHLIEFGDASDCGGKFHRLQLFYRQVMTKTGFDRYSIIDLRFAGQVIGTRKENRLSTQDSLQAVKNVQQMIRAAMDMQADTSAHNTMQPLEHDQLTEQNLTNYDLVPDEEDSSASVPKTKKKKH